MLASPPSSLLAAGEAQRLAEDEPFAAWSLPGWAHHAGCPMSGSPMSGSSATGSSTSGSSTSGSPTSGSSTSGSSTSGSSTSGSRLAGTRADWLAAIDQALSAHKAILLRDTGCRNETDFQQLLDRLCPGRVRYDYASTPRSSVGDRVYTSTEYPAHQVIPLHNELSYAQQWPDRLWFFCQQPAAQGGATPLANSNSVYRSLDKAVVARFEKLGVQYVRNYNTGVDLSWQDAFGTQDRAEVQALCARQGLSFEWTGDQTLRTWQRCPATIQDPLTGEKQWFNQAHLFHPSALQTKIREALLAVFEPQELPRTAHYGDGTPIEDQVLDHVRSVYADHARTFDWQAGDIVIVDNRCVAHGREAFQGDRRVLVAMQKL